MTRFNRLAARTAWLLAIPVCACVATVDPNVPVQGGTAFTINRDPMVYNPGPMPPPAMGEVMPGFPTRTDPAMSAPPADLFAPAKGQNAPQPANVSLTYAGTGTQFKDPGATFALQASACAKPIRIEGWKVTGDRVTYDRFSGVVQPDGSLTMKSGEDYIFGRYTGTHFEGRLWSPPPGCAYSIVLDPV